MSDPQSATRRSRLLESLYGAAETLLEAVADSTAIDEAPLHHRAQALDAIGRFIHRLEKHEAAGKTVELAGVEPEAGEPIFTLDLGYERREYEGDMLDAFVAMALKYPGSSYEKPPEVVRRIEELRQQDPGLLDYFDPDAAWIYMGSVYRPASFSGTPPVQPEIVRSQPARAA